MEISIRRNDEGAVIDVSGRMVFGTHVRDLHDAVRQLVGQGTSVIVVNLGQVSYLDSTGLEMLVASYVTCIRSGAGLSVINASPRATEVLRVTKLDSLFGGTFN